MKTSIECIPCFVRQAAEAISLSTPEPLQRARILREVMHALADLDWQGSPPMVAAELHRIIRKMTGNLDPYLTVKCPLVVAQIGEASGSLIAKKIGDVRSPLASVFILK